MNSIILSLALLSPIAANTEPVAQARWTCQATDYQGNFGTGIGADRTEAAQNAMQQCQARSRTLCSVQNCIRKN